MMAMGRIKRIFKGMFGDRVRVRKLTLGNLHRALRKRTYAGCEIMVPQWDPARAGYIVFHDGRAIRLFLVDTSWMTLARLAETFRRIAEDLAEEEDTGDE